MARNIEVVFDQKTGDFVLHYSGVRTHAEEHALTDRIKEELRKLGFDVDEDHSHDKPRIPEVDEETVARVRTRVKV
jgi:hypothetical protein